MAPQRSTSDYLHIPLIRTEKTSSGIKSFLALAAILLTTAILFAPSLRYDFLNWDDNEHIYEHPYVRDLNANSVKEIFKDTSLNAYFPLTTLSFALEYRLVGPDPFFFHFNNLLLHLGVVSLIFLLALRMGLPTLGASAAALLFAIHPIHVESVVWVSERKDVLYSLFYLMALNQYWIWAKYKKRSTYIMSIVFGLLSMLAKPMAVSLPFILLLFDWFQQRKFDRGVLLEKVPFLIYALPLFGVTFLAHDHIPGGAGLKGILIFVWSLTFYIGKFLIPYPLNPLYPLPQPVHLAETAYVLAFGILIIVTLLTIQFRKNRWWILGLGYYLLSIGIMLKIDNVEASLVADRYMYLPSLGFCLLAGYAVTMLMKDKKCTECNCAANNWIFVVALVLMMSIATRIYMPVWKDSFSLWNYVISQPGARATAFNNRGNLYLKKGDFNNALKDYNEALRRDPTHKNAQFNRKLLLK